MSLVLVQCKIISIIYVIVNAHVLLKATVPRAVEMERWNVSSVNAMRAFFRKFVTAKNRI